jgi:hypothetical protein
MRRFSAALPLLLTLTLAACAPPPHRPHIKVGESYVEARKSLIRQGFRPQRVTTLSEIANGDADQVGGLTLVAHALFPEIFGCAEPACVSVFRSGVDGKLWRVTSTVRETGPVELASLSVTGAVQAEDAETALYLLGMGNAQSQAPQGLRPGAPYAEVRKMLIRQGFKPQRILPLGRSGSDRCAAISTAYPEHLCAPTGGDGHAMYYRDRLGFFWMVSTRAAQADPIDIGSLTFEAVSPLPDQGLIPMLAITSGSSAAAPDAR